MIRCRIHDFVGHDARTRIDIGQLTNQEVS